MEIHPLNMAHQQHRRAEAHLKHNRFDEAMQCHHNAAELLLDAMKSTTSSVALESMTMQHSYHLKQKDIIMSRKERDSRVKKAIDQIKQAGKDPSLPVSDNSKLQVDIYKNISETDSLLDLLLNKKCIDMVETCDGIKLESDIINNTEAKDETIPEKIKNLNKTLHSLVEQLMFKVEIMKDDNTALKEKVKYLEKERTKYLNIQMSDFAHQNNFSDLGLGNNSYTQESNPNLQSEVTLNTKGYVTKQIHQPHFDLSAFKD